MAFSGEQLQRRRAEAGKSRHEVVLGLAKAGEAVTERTVTRWESGQGEPRAGALAALAEILECEIIDFFALDQAPVEGVA